MAEAGASIPAEDTAGSWIGNAFQKFGASFRSKVPRSPFLSSEDIGNNYSVPWIQFALERSPQVLRREFDRLAYTVQAVVNGRSRKKSPLQKSFFLSSLSSLELSSPISNKVEQLEKDKEIAKKTLSEIGKTKSVARLLESGRVDSGVAFDFKDSCDMKQSFTFGSDNSSAEEDNLEDTEVFNREESIRHRNEIEIQKTEESFSRNYSIFCEKLKTIHDKANIKCDNEDLGLFKSNSFTARGTIRIKRDNTVVKSKTNKSKVSGSIDVSLQHFHKSRQLRIVVLSAESSVRENSKLYCSVKLTGSRSPQKQKTRKMNSKSGTATFKETFYMETDTDELAGNLLRIRLYTLTKFLKRSCLLGEAMLDLEDLDLTFDTAISVKLRNSKSRGRATDVDDFEIKSEDRSIHAEVRAQLQESEFGLNRHKLLARHRSLPQIGRLGIM